MGQPVLVTETSTATPGVMRYELNRALTGSGHEHYSREKAIVANRPPDVLASRLMEANADIQRVHIFSNVVTVELTAGSDTSGLIDVIRDLYVHYVPGVVPSLQ